MDLATNMQYYLNGLERLVQQVTEQFQLEGAGIEESLEFIKNLTSKLTETVASSLPQLLDFGMAVGSGIISGITAVISSIYMLAGKGRLVPQLKKCSMLSFQSGGPTNFCRSAATPTRCSWVSSTAS